MEMLTITSPSPSGDGIEEVKSTRKKTIFIMCRSHPGESPTSIVCQGRLEMKYYLVCVDWITMCIFRFRINWFFGEFPAHRRCFKRIHGIQNYSHDEPRWSFQRQWKVAEMILTFKKRIYTIHFMFQDHPSSEQILIGCGTIFQNTFILLLKQRWMQSDI